MARVTVENVKEIVSTKLLDAVVQVWVDVASTIVTQNSDCIGGDETLLTQVELQLSAHFVAMQGASTRNAVVKEGPTDFTTTYASPMAIANTINQTPYGTAANYLSGGCLSKLEKQTARILALGN